MNRLSLMVVIPVLSLSLFACPVMAAPITGGTGPGGLGLTDGSSTLELWLHAGAGVLNSGGAAASNGQDVATWQDQSGNAGYDAIQTVAGRRPVFTAAGANGMPTITFSSSDQTHLLGAAFLDNAQSRATMIAVVRQNASALGRVLSLQEDSNTPGPQFLIRGTTTGSQVFARGSDASGDSASVSPPAITGSYHILTGVFNRSPGQVQGAIDGNAYLSASKGSAFTANGFDGYSIGSLTSLSGGADTQHFDGPISEIIVFTKTIDDAERAIVDSYLGAKYGLAPANDKYTGDDIAKGGYDLDVFGIGRIDANNQVTNSGSQGLGIEATGGSLGNDEWVLAGHKAPINSLVATDLPAGVLSRWDRVWYVDKTAVDGIDIDLSFDFTDAGLAPPAASEFALLYRSDQAGDFADLALTPAINSDTVTFAVDNSNLASGYYTLGIIPEPNSLLLLTLALLGLILRFPRRR